MANHATTLPQDNHGHGEHHITSAWVLFRTLIMLLILMGVTIGASYIQLPSIGPISGTVINNLVALAIATVKAYIVITIFMGVKHQTTLTKIWVYAGFAVLVLLFGIFGDYWTRKFEPVSGWEKNGESAFPREFAPAGKPPVPNNVNLRPRG
ncbi:hypothetical protein EON81_00365 [bacterium]|nr:MAG: hypothetical protein EON81_00365 [bacterium]